MADWVDPTLISTDDPVTAEQGNMFQYNPVAITEGAVGAPRIQDAALGTTVTGAGIAWVGARIASIGAGGVGSHVMAGRRNSIPIPACSFGDLSAGGYLRACNVLGEGETALTGTWRCLGTSAGTASSTSTATNTITMWVRVS